LFNYVRSLRPPHLLRYQQATPVIVAGAAGMEG